MRKNRKILCVMFVLLMLFNTMTVFASEAEETTETAMYPLLDTESASLLSSAEPASVTNSDFGPAGIEDGAVYAMQNVGSELWASTSIHSASYFYIWNVFQNSVWNNTAQTFKFVKTGSDDNTYLIYPFEYNNYNSNMTRALYCNYNLISSQQPEQANVTYANYVASKASGYEWIVEQRDGYIHTIRLKADPRYILCGLGDTAGNDSSTAAGNIVVSKQSSATATPTDYQKWNIKYVVDSGKYHMKNIVSGNYMNAYGVVGNAVNASSYQGLDDQKFQITHYQNGQYLIYDHANDYGLLTRSSYIFNGDYVYLYSAVDDPTIVANKLWTFDRMTDGTFQIKNVFVEEAGYDYKLVVSGDTIVLNGLYPNLSNSIYSWKLFEIRYEAAIQNNYDKGYFVYYNETEATGRNKIDSYTRFVAEEYLEKFHLSIEFNSAS